MKFNDFGAVKTAFSTGTIFTCNLEELRSALSVLGPRTAGDTTEGKTGRMINIINALCQMKASQQLHAQTQRVAWAAVIVAIASTLPQLVALIQTLCCK